MKQPLLFITFTFFACLLNAQQYSAWYSLEELTLMAPGDTYVEFLMKNSESKYVDENGTVNRGVNSIAAGSVINVADDLWDLTADPFRKVRNNDISTLDSISFPYLYVRNTATNTVSGSGTMPVVDTLLIYWYNSEHLKKENGTVKFSTPGGKWDLYNLTPTIYFKVDTLLLTADNSTTVLNTNGGYENSFSLKRMTLASPGGLISDSTAQSKLIGFCLQFRSGVIGADSGYMIYQRPPATLPAGSKRPNYFGYSISVESFTDSWADFSSSYSGSMFVLNSSAKSMLNGYFGFIPGSAFNLKKIIKSDFFISSKMRNDPYTVSANITHETCIGQADGSITISASGGTAPYTYSVNNGSWGPANTFNNLAPGMYEIRVKDATDDLRISHAYVWTTYNIIAGMIGGPSAVEKGGSATYAAASQQGGTTYQWTVDGGLITSGQNTASINIAFDDNIGTSSIRLIVTSSTCRDTSTLLVSRVPNTAVPQIISGNHQISYYPIPASQVLSFDRVTDDIFVEVYNILGKKELTDHVYASNPKLDVSMLSAGTYIIHIKSPEGSQTGKLVIE